MGVMDKFVNFMKFKPMDNNDGYLDDDYDEDEGYLDEDEPVETKQTFSSRRSSLPAEEPMETEHTTRRNFGNKVTHIRQTSSKRTIDSNGMEVCVIQPKSFDESREITDTLLAGRTLVLNLEGMDVDVAQRIIDFISGSCYAINGKLQKVSNYIFIITPANVGISGDIQEQIFGSGFDSTFRS